ncbi:alpha/beta hydrolase fold [Rhodovulum sp. ES.010]|uniref:alpha/beta hydrolase n=1 Tax=Rhodovulum sp. ES.010 TaxID=1882821 RepID=UPI00092A97FD|nr:alpha/beta hydrolase [Rhodovulum sp. ES.010]SIO41977.1 alpha/beta hydrolase fold [Rhodovulum sp. ES.010]
MSSHDNLADPDNAYANAAHIPGAADYPPRWAAAAAAFRATACGETDLPYGDHPRQRFDLFLPDGRPRGLAVFVHGGYWLRFDKSFWSHLAAGPLARGWAVALPSYRLAPEVRIAEITADIAAALPVMARLVPGPIALAGHSAGGHLVARMLCADAGLPDAVAARLARVVPISPVADLRPLIRTQMNDSFRLDGAGARAESPVAHAPRASVPVTVWVGAEERPVFLDQARWLAEAWPGAALHIHEGRHHFDVIEGLTRPDSLLTAAVLGPGAEG